MKKQQRVILGIALIAVSVGTAAASTTHAYVKRACDGTTFAGRMAAVWDYMEGTPQVCHGRIVRVLAKPGQEVLVSTEFGIEYKGKLLPGPDVYVDGKPIRVPGADPHTSEFWTVTAWPAIGTLPSEDHLPAGMYMVQRTDGTWTWATPEEVKGLSGPQAASSRRL